MEIEFDPAKDAANIAKHGLSLAEAVNMVPLIRFEDTRFEETRYRAYGYLDGLPHCVAYTVREGKVRVISFRRAHEKEIRRHAP